MTVVTLQMEVRMENGAVKKMRTGVCATPRVTNHSLAPRRPDELRHQQPPHPPQVNRSLTSKVADGEVLVFGVFLWRFEGELLSGTRQILVFSAERLDHLFDTKTRTEIFHLTSLFLPRTSATATLLSFEAAFFSSGTYVLHISPGVKTHSC